MEKESHVELVEILVPLKHLVLPSSHFFSYKVTRHEEASCWTPNQQKLLPAT